jgi:nucleotide-binding universal stress UspA family protein
MKLLAYTDGSDASIKAVHFAAELMHRLSGEMAVITVRSGTHATETPPPVGIETPLKPRHELGPGLQRLMKTAERMIGTGSLAPQPVVAIRDMAHGYLFVCRTPSGERVPFYECFGHFIESLNQEIDRHGHNLLLIAPPRRSSLRRLVVGDTTRKLALDLHSSVLVVRGGGPDSRFVVCADGSPSARRQFPMLRHLLRAIRRPLELVWVKKPDTRPEEAQTAEACLRHAVNWLETCDKSGTVHRLEGTGVADKILEVAGSDSVITMGASLRHDVYRRMRGSLPMEVLARTESSLLLVKLPPEADDDFFKDPFTC